MANNEKYMNRFILLITLISSLHGCAEQSEHKPSPGAADVAGAMGTFEFKPQDWADGKTTWWKDTDGIDPGTAGCHIGTDGDGTPNDRMFGEACLINGLLVESNPGANELHSHKNDTGHPDTFDCAAWCVAKGNSGGSCQVAVAPPCEQSARCVCD